MNEYLKKVFLVAKRDWLEAVSTKMFWIGAMLGPILGIAIFAIAGIASFQAGTQEGRYVVVDESDGIADEIRNEILNSDLRKFLNSLVEKQSEVPLINELKESIDVESIDTFIEEVLPLVQYPKESRKSNQTGLLSERFADWWLVNHAARIELAPGVSTARFQELFPIDLSEENLSNWLQQEHIIGYFVIPADIVTSNANARFVTNDVIKEFLPNWYEQFATTVVRRHRLESSNIDQELARWVLGSVRFTTNKAVEPGTGDEATQEVSELDRVAQFVPAIYVYILWFMVLFGATMLLTGTVEEKSSKLVEILLSNLDAGQLMDGKLLGISATLLTIIGVWVGFFLVLFGGAAQLLGGVIPADINLVSILFKPIYIFNFLVYWVLGFMFYGYLLSAIGSLCTTTREAGAFAAPVQILLVIPIILIVPLAMDPSSTMADVMAFIPPFTPFVMMVTASDIPSPPIYILILCWMVVWVVGARWFCGRIYRRGILMENKPEGFRALVRLAKN